MEALRSTRKRAPEDLTLIEMLNAFDQVVNRNGAPSSKSSKSGDALSSGNEISS